MGADGFDALRQKLIDRERRLQNLKPAMQVIGEEIVLRVSNAFRDRQSPAGDDWKPLAQSTLRARAAKVPGAKRRGKAGGLTKGARAKRAAAIANPQAITPLVDTGRLRASAAQYKADAHGVSWSVVGYGGPHIAGNAAGRPPKRNFSPYEFRRDGQGLAMIPSMLSYSLRTIRRYVETGKP